MSIKISYEEMESKAGSLDRSRDTINGELNNLLSQIQNLTSEGFVTDQASGAFNEMFHEYKMGADKTIDALNRIASLLRQISSSMRQHDQEIASKIHR